jgi:hypothetical protein
VGATVGSTAGWVVVGGASGVGSGVAASAGRVAGAVVLVATLNGRVQVGSAVRADAPTAFGGPVWQALSSRASAAR